LSGIKLRTKKISPIKMERLKWVCILLLSHIIIAMLNLDPPTVIKEDTATPRPGHTRLQLQIKSKVPVLKKKIKITLLTKDLDLISREAIILKRLGNNDSIDSSGDLYLVEIPETDLNNLVKFRTKKLIAYPSSKKILTKKSKQRKTNYEIYF